MNQLILLLGAVANAKVRAAIAVDAQVESDREDPDHETETPHS